MIIDDKGRLFGKINLFDLVILITLSTLIGGTVGRYRYNQGQPQREGLELQLRLCEKENSVCQEAFSKREEELLNNYNILNRTVRENGNKRDEELDLREVEIKRKEIELKELEDAIRGMEKVFKEKEKVFKEKEEEFLLKIDKEKEKEELIRKNIVYDMYLRGLTWP